MHFGGFMSALMMAATQSGPADPTTHTTQPIVTGSTVLAIKYADGVMLAADTLASYGSLARYKDMQRLKKVGDATLIGASGEMSDFQVYNTNKQNISQYHPPLLILFSPHHFHLSQF
jgi:20S proteasome alpha/beta subunit